MNFKTSTFKQFVFVQDKNCVIDIFQIEYVYQEGADTHVAFKSGAELVLEKMEVGKFWVNVMLDNCGGGHK